MAAPTQELIDALYLEKLRQLETTTPEQRFLDGPRLFDRACEWTKAGIRSQHPGISEEDVLQILRERLALGRQLERRL